MFWAVIVLVWIVGARLAFELIWSGKAKIMKHFKSTVFRKGVVSQRSNYSTLWVLTSAKQEFVNSVVGHDCLNESHT
jgi:CRISPR/Cas system-associated protein Cas10 (large subunit of type III CRISPR-Cas system)